MGLTIVGVRHHSPACAGLVRRTLRGLQPAWVLIEGPCDFNPRIGELALDHTPPVALFTHHFAERRRYASWAPFCEHSPEWIGVRQGLEQGAEVRFIDLPGWADPLRGLENRYADGAVRQDPSAALQTATGEVGYDAIWDALFELPEAEGLAERLETYFEGVRQFVPPELSDLRREEHMGAWIRWALGQGGDVVVICGGYHAPALRRLALGPTPTEPPAEPESGPDARCETWLIPFTERRLDSFAGYASGLPSPAWYRWTWQLGPEGTPKWALRATAEALRARGQLVSAADTIAAWTHALALARLRGHASVGRVDLLDAVASTWIKQALDAPLPWSSRRRLAPATHPVLVELVQALSGDARGKLAPDTPMPPLVADVAATREQLDLEVPITGSRKLVLSTASPADQACIHALERMLLLGFSDVGAGRNPDPLQRSYRLQADEHALVTLLEAASYGPTLESAAAARLEELAAEAHGFAALVSVLDASLRAGLTTLSQAALAALATEARAESDLRPLGAGLGQLVGIVRHGGLLPSQRAALVSIADAALDRGLWLTEGLHGDGDVDLDRVAAIRALRDCAQQLPVRVTPGRTTGVFARVAASPTAPADLRGACLGALASLGSRSLDETTELAMSALDGLDPVRLGDYLAGLLGLAREVLTSGGGLLEGIDGSVSALDLRSFEIALPSLRLAFQGLPPRERQSIGSLVAALHGAKGVRLDAKLKHSPMGMVRAAALEEEVRQMFAALGVRL